MPIHPQCQFILDVMAASGAKPLESLSVSEARAQFAAGAEARKALAGPEQAVARVEDRVIETSGHPVPVRVYWPSLGSDLPALVYFHGGGWVLGGLDMVDRVCRQLANAAECVVVSVDYGLAPEYKFPQPLEDAYRATEYVAQHARELSVDPNRIAVGGDSAGGNLAAAVALRIRDEGGPRVAFQLLVYPVTDYHDNRPSMSEFDGTFLTRASMEWFWGHYLRHPEDPFGSLHQYQTSYRSSCDCSNPERGFGDVVIHSYCIHQGCPRRAGGNTCPESAGYSCWINRVIRSHRVEERGC